MKSETLTLIIAYLFAVAFPVLIFLAILRFAA
jgi:hypothetical protein